MSKGVRELHDLIQAVKATPGWEVEEKPREWHVYPPLSDKYVVVKKADFVPANQLRNVGAKLEKAGWTKEVAEKAVRDAAREKTRTERAKADRKTAKLLEAAEDKPVQSALPLYEAKTVGDASHLPPGPLETEEIYGVDNILLTPELAQKFLDLNIENNRPASAANYRYIAEDILAGRWKRNGFRISFARVKDSRGKWVYRLIDGAKRCHAVIQAGVAVPVDLLYNLDRDAFSTIDIQQPRSAWQHFHMRGIPNPNMVAAGVKVVRLYDQGNWSLKVTIPHLDELYDSNPSGWQSSARFVANLLKQGGRAARGIFAQRTLVAAHYLCAREFPSNPRLNEFFEGAVLGTNLPSSRDPRFKLRREFSDERDLGVRKTSKRHLAMILKAYNAFMTNSSDRVTWDEPESMPVPVMGG